MNFLRISFISNLLEFYFSKHISFDVLSQIRNKNLIFFYQKFVLDQLNTSGTTAYYELMKVGFPSKVEMAELFGIIEPSLESRHVSLGLNNCCLILLLANGFQARDFVFGKTEIHFRPGKQQLLDELCDEMKQPDISNIISKFKKGFVAFMRRVLYLRIMFLARILGQRKFSLCEINIVFFCGYYQT